MTGSIQILSLNLFAMHPAEAAGAPEHPTAAIPSVHSRYALIIGIDDYEPSSPVSDLRYTANDATTMARILVESQSFPAENVFLMTPQQDDPNRRPTGENIQHALDWLSHQAHPELQFVYISSHGGAEVVGHVRETLVFPQDYQRSTAPVYRGVSVTSILDALETAGAPMRVVVIDACRNIAGGKGTAPLVAADELPAPVSEGSVVLYASDFGGYSYEEDAVQMGRFTYFFTRALSGYADGYRASGGALVGDGTVTLQEAFEWIFDQMVLRNRAPDGDQLPRLWGEHGGTFPLTFVRTSIPSDLDAVQRVFGDAERAIESGYWPTTYQLADEGRLRLRGLTEVATPAVAASWFRIEGTRLWSLGDRSGAMSALTAAYLAAPDHGPAATYPPGARELTNLDLEAQAWARGNTWSSTALPSVAGAHYRVNGHYARAIPDTVPSVVQGVWNNGQVKFTVEASSILQVPRLSAPPRVIPTPRARALVAGTAGAGAVGAGLLGAVTAIKAAEIRGIRPEDLPTGPGDTEAGYTREGLNELKAGYDRSLIGAAVVGGLSAGLGGLTIYWSVAY